MVHSPAYGVLKASHSAVIAVVPVDAAAVVVTATAVVGGGAVGVALVGVAVASAVVAAGFVVVAAALVVAVAVVTFGQRLRHPRAAFERSCTLEFSHPVISVG